MGFVFTVMLIFLFAVIIISLICTIIKYVFDGFGLMEMAKKKNEKYPWLSWVPYAKEYLRGKLAYNANIGGYVIMSVFIILTGVFLVPIFIFEIRNNKLQEHSVITENNL